MDSRFVERASFTSEKIKPFNSTIVETSQRSVEVNPYPQFSHRGRRFWRICDVTIILLCFFAPQLTAWGESQELNLIVEDFESRKPTIGGMSLSAETQAALSDEHPLRGNKCVRLDYHLNRAEGLNYIEIITPRHLGMKPKRMSFGVYGDKSGEMVRLRIIDSKGEWHQFDAGKIDFEGWRTFEVDLSAPHGFWQGDKNGKLDPPLRFHSIVLDSEVEPAEGTIFFDHITCKVEGAPAEFVELSVECKASARMFWGKQNPPKLSLIISSGIETPCNTEVNWRLLDHRENPLGESEKVKVVVSDAKRQGIEVSPKLSRFGVYFLDAEWQAWSEKRKLRKAFAWLPEPVAHSPETPFAVQGHFCWPHWKLEGMDLLSKMGAGWFRDELHWGGTEVEKGKFQFPKRWDVYMNKAKEIGLRPLIILDYGNKHYDEGNAPTSDEAVKAFAEYCRRIVRRYGSICKHWEVWNEPNIGFWKPKPNPKDYARLLKAAYSAVKGVDPEATVLGVCTSGTDYKFIEAVLKEGAAKFMDAISVHPYRYPRSPEKSDLIGELKRLKELIDRYEAGELKVWITEFGYPTHVGSRGLPEHLSAAYTVRFYIQALTLPFMERIFYYDFQCDGEERSYNEHNFGLVRFDLSPKVGYAAYRTMAWALSGKKFVREISVAQNAICYEFADDRNEQALALWSPTGAGASALRFGRAEVTVTDLMGNAARHSTVDGTLTLALDNEPVFIVGKLGKVESSEPHLGMPEGVKGVPGETIEIAMTLSEAADKIGRRLIVRAPISWRNAASSAILDNKESKVRLVITSPKETPLGAYTLFASLLDAKDNTIAEGACGIELINPISLALKNQGMMAVAEVKQTIGENDRKVKLRIEQEGTQGKRSSSILLRHDEVKEVQFPLIIEDKDSYMPARVKATASLESGLKVVQSRQVGLLPCPKASKPIVLDGELKECHRFKPGNLSEAWQIQQLVKDKWDGVEDLSAKVWAFWDEDALYVAVRALDDTHSQNFDPEQMWKGDSVQVGIETGGRYYQFGAALADDGSTTIYQWKPESRDKAAFKAIVKRKEHLTLYELSISWSALHVHPREGMSLRFACIVNDNDGAEREGWIEWFQGIGYGEGPSLFGELSLQGKREF